MKATAKLLVTATAILFHFVSSAQVTFERLYNPGTSLSIDLTFDGGYIIGKTISYDTAGYYKIDSIGNILWMKSYPNARMGSIIQCDDTGYIFCASDNNFGDTYPIFVKTNAAGDTLWRKNFYVFGENGYGIEVIKSFDNGYIFISSDHIEMGETHFLIRGTNDTANVLWETLITSTLGSVWVDALQKTLDSNYVAVNSRSNYNPELNIAKISRNGILLWDTTYSQASYNQGTIQVNSVCAAFDGGFLVLGQHEDNIADSNFMFMLKTNANGDSLWSKEYVYGNYGMFFSGIEMQDSGFLLLGNAADTGALVLMKTDANGDSLWTKKYFGLGRAFGSSIKKAHDCGFIVVGSTTDTVANLTYDYVLKLDCNGDVITNIQLPTVNQSTMISVYPNPAKDNFTISVNQEMQNGLVEVFNSLGNKIYSKHFSGSTTTISNKLNSGFYFVRVSDVEEVVVRKLIVE